MKTKHIIIAALISLTGLFFISPYWALYNIKNALTNNDAEQLNKYVDYSSVKEDLKQQVNNVLRVDVENPMMVSFAASIADKMVNSMVNPEALMKLVNVQKSFDKTINDKNKEAGSEDASPYSGVEQKFNYAGVNRFEVTIRSKLLADAFTVVLERQGFASWKVVAIDFKPLLSMLKV